MSKLTAEENSVDFADRMQCDVQASQVRSPTPDGFERDASKHTTPVQAQANTAQIGQNLVAEISATVKAFVSVSPHAKYKNN